MSSCVLCVQVKKIHKKAGSDTESRLCDISDPVNRATKSLLRYSVYQHPSQDNNSMMKY